ncbi:MAG: hypothetical protein FWE45_00505 [Firmicutes bacterium]|nr:hypothetical protein [Bacillota bacterium]
MEDEKSNANSLYWENQKLLKMLDMVDECQSMLDEEKKARNTLVKKCLLVGGTAAGLGMLSTVAPQ